MSLNIDDSRTDLIIKLSNLIDQKLPAQDATLVKSFLDQFYLGVSPYDLREKSIADLYGALLSQWHLIYKRQPGELKLQVYNPQLEQNGWQSPHTIIEFAYENKPFILESIRLALNRLGINIHLVIHAEGVGVVRDKRGVIQEIVSANIAGLAANSNVITEAPIYIEIDKQTDRKILEKIATTLQKTLEDIDLMVRDWPVMLERLQQASAQLSQQQSPMIAEVQLFLQWLANNHFTFIGYSEYVLRDEHDQQILEYIPDSGLGVLSSKRQASLTRNLSDMYPEAQTSLLNKDILLFGKTDTMATVHRPAYTDFVGIKFFDENGNLTKVKRFIGLYTASVYNEPVMDIPVISDKIDRIFAMAGLPRTNHDGRALQHIIENLPRDELFQAQERELFNMAIGVLHLQERQKIRLFIRRDTYGRFFSCLVFVPREQFNSQLRAKIGDILREKLHGDSVSFDTLFSESILARIHFMIRVNPRLVIDYDQAAIEKLLVEAARSWKDDLHDAMIEHWGEERTNELFFNYENAFPGSYREIFSARTAVLDIEHIENLKQFDNDHLEMSLYRPIEDPEDSLRFKLFRRDHTIPLSDVVPILEHMGLRIISERPHEIILANNGTVWINDYRMVHPRGEPLAPDVVKAVFQEAFSAIWSGIAENDGFNKLVLGAQLHWRDINILRLYYRYLRQSAMVFSQASFEDALNNNPNLAKPLVRYFYIKFDVDYVSTDRAVELAKLKAQIETSLESVASINEDRIIRAYLNAMMASIRTNFFQHADNGKCKEHIAIKLASAQVTDLPLPKPLYEIFVYSTKVEGIHLRADKVARGGIRWSDRHDDFRTEVLGLMKAQNVKNAVIVPLGAKGGFVVRSDLTNLDREQRLQQGVDCYKTFIRALLDLTDNIVNNETIHPPRTICWDDNDPYLVVAADKGTATFSDIANAISAEFKFWLKDAFASGGATGYDHKKMGITARGAWESVKMHFKQLGIDPQSESITVIGIGDMAGDVFGNGMLLSDKIKLIAAFNHVHIFFDPNPDPSVSFAERKRLFELPHSSWTDYNPELISAGGGVFSRSAKKIALTPQMKEILNCKMDQMQPFELIRAILMLKVDLFFNGGIGTFVKNSHERNLEVGDRANDALRINGDQLNAKVVCEGGNLGFTQLGRVEYAQLGGLINTDAIDNSGGVNCSDNEVNIKILLNEIIQAGDLTEKQRNKLLESMTNEVADLVLANNIKQNEAITLVSYKSAGDLQMHYRLFKQLEKTAGLDPVVEFMPDAEEIADRSAKGQGFVRPEIAVLMAYTKIELKKQLLGTKLIEDPRMIEDVKYYFPKQLRQDKYYNYIKNHRLKHDLIATQISNYIIDEMGINFIQRLQDESGANSEQIAAAYIIAREVFDVYKMRAQIRALGVEVDAKVRTNILLNTNRFIRRATRWFLRNPQDYESIDDAIKKYKPQVLEIETELTTLLTQIEMIQLQEDNTKLIAEHVPPDLAMRSASFGYMGGALDIVSAASEYNFSLTETAQTYFALGELLQFGWFSEMIKNQQVENHWDALARAAFRDALDREQRNLTLCVLKTPHGNGHNATQRVAKWLHAHPQLFERWMFLINDLKATTNPDFTMFAVALRELLDLVQAIKT